tara:strand:- start:1017 stop:1667 length:651 start_codon:yes stop_codon:yes gene_type:complete
MKILLRNAFLLALLAQNLEANEALYMKFADKSVNSSTLVERQGLKYQVNTKTPFSGRFVTYEDEYGFCAVEAGSYKKGLLHGPFEGYEACGTLFSFKTGYKNGLEHGKYTEYMEGFLSMEGNRVDGVDQGEWIGYEYGQVIWIENVKNGVTDTLTSFSYYDNGQISTKEGYNNKEELHGISEAYHQNGQLKSKIEYQNGVLHRVIEEYDFNGNQIN